MEPVFGAIHEVTEEKLEFAKQIGGTGIIVHSLEAEGRRWALWGEEAGKKAKVKSVQSSKRVPKQ